MKCDKQFMRLYAVTDQSWLGDRTLPMDVEVALKGGVTCLQVREKDLAQDSFLKESFEIKELCKKYQVPFIINDNVSIMLKCDADGIHVGQSDMEACQVRTLIGEDKILGVSVQAVEQAKKAEAQGADYLGVGAVFATTTKEDANIVDRATLEAICKSVSIPVVAIGGIYKENIMELKGSGVEGVALVSAIFASTSIEKECKELRKLSEEMVTGKRE